MLLYYVLYLFFDTMIHTLIMYTHNSVSQVSECQPPSLTLFCVKSKVDRLLCTHCAVSEGSDGHCILSHCLQTWQGPTCVCCVSHCKCPILPVNEVHEGPHVWGCWSVPLYFHTGRDRACQPWVERRPWTDCGVYAMYIYIYIYI